MKVLMVAGEVAPFVKTGGLGEVMESLPKAIRRLGHDVRILAPLYGNVDKQKYAFMPIFRNVPMEIAGEKTHVCFYASVLDQRVPVYFFQSERYFPSDHRIYDPRGGNLPYYAFNLSMFKLLNLLDWVPDVIHVHDWHAGLIPNVIKHMPKDSPFASVATVQTIHNSAFVAMEHQPDLAEHLQDDGLGKLTAHPDKVKYLNFLRRGIYNADAINTVSERYALELLEPDTSHGLHDLLNDRANVFFGIRNGVDYGQWNPMFDPHIPVNYDHDILHRKYDNKRALQHRLNLPVDADVPILGMHARITEQKGFGLVLGILDKLMSQGVQLVVVGAGQKNYAKQLRDKMAQYPSQVAFREGQDASEELGSLVYAGSDILLMPSLFEPCGVGQMVSLRYGTIPVVRRTGGLADTINNYDPYEEGNKGNGFVFNNYTQTALGEAIDRALSVWQNREEWDQLIHRAMTMSYSWEIPAQKYERLYEIATKQKQGVSWNI